MSIAGLARQVLERARVQGLMLVTAESCTGGLVGAALTEIPGSSDVFDRGFITYSNAAKTRMLGVSTDLLKEHGAVSKQVAEAMATGALARSDAQLAVSVTGVAGPGGSDHKPEGMVWFALADRNQVRAQMHQFGPVGRSQVRQKSVEAALQILLDDLLPGIP